MGFKSCTSSPDLFSGFLAAPPKNEVLAAMSRMIDWEPLRELMAPLYKAGSGREGYDPVMLFKLLLLEHLYDLSDVAVVEEAADRLSFREFTGIDSSDAVPDDTTLVVFRRRLRQGGLFDKLFAQITMQMEQRGLGVRPGSIKVVDATLIRAAVGPPSKSKEGVEQAPPLDCDADFTVKNGKPLYGYKIHLAQERTTGLVTAHELTGASVHDSNVFESLLDGTESEVLADKGYYSVERLELLRLHRTKASIMKRAKRNKPLSRWQVERNRSIGRIRSFIEGTNAALKRWRRCGRALYRGIERVWGQVTLGVLVHNLMRYAALDRARCVQ